MVSVHQHMYHSQMCTIGWQALVIVTHNPAERAQIERYLTSPKHSSELISSLSLTTMHSWKFFICSSTLQPYSMVRLAFFVAMWSLRLLVINPGMCLTYNVEISAKSIQLMVHVNGFRALRILILSNRFLTRQFITTLLQVTFHLFRLTEILITITLLVM